MPGPEIAAGAVAAGIIRFHFPMFSCPASSYHEREGALAKLIRMLTLSTLSHEVAEGSPAVLLILKDIFIYDECGHNASKYNHGLNDAL